MRCLYSRFEQYPHCVTKVLQTLLRYLDRREWLSQRYLPQISGSDEVDLRSAGVSLRPRGSPSRRPCHLERKEGTRSRVPSRSRKTLCLLAVASAGWPSGDFRFGVGQTLRSLDFARDDKVMRDADATLSLSAKCQLPIAGY